MQLPFIPLPRARALTAVIAGLGCAAPALATLDVEAMAPQETFAASGPALHLAQTSTPPAPGVAAAGELILGLSEPRKKGGKNGSKNGLRDLLDPHMRTRIE